MSPNDLGLLGAALVNGIRLEDLPLLKGASEATAAHPRAAAMGQLLARSVCALFEAAGKRASVACQLYEQLSRQPVWEEAHWDLMEPALRVISAHRSAGQEKSASPIMRAGQALAGRIAGRAPDVGNLLMWLALAGGTSLGTGAYMLHRGATGDADTTALEDKIKYYNQVASDVENELGQDYPETRNRRPAFPRS